MSYSPLFYAKILLFGEYGIIKNSMGLSIPFNVYQGAFQFPKEERTPAMADSTASLRDFYNHLVQLELNGELPVQLDLDRMQADLEAGLYFDSSIPQGFGVGSSGALVAAIYDRYAINKIVPEESLEKGDISLLKKVFGQLESFFHGKSSGIDPLICYLRLPLLIKSQDDLGTVVIPQSGEGKGAIFLLNSGSPGKTQPMVQLFLDKMKHEGFRSSLKDFIKYNDACIKAFLKGDTQPLFKNLKKLSSIVLDQFTPMIPEHFHTLWKQGIDSNSYYLKLCGSGGGGFILGFAPDYELAKGKLEAYQPEVIYRF